MIDILLSTTEYLQNQLKTPGYLEGYYRAIEQELENRKQQEQEFTQL